MVSLLVFCLVFLITQFFLSKRNLSGWKLFAASFIVSFVATVLIELILIFFIYS